MAAERVIVVVGLFVAIMALEGSSSALYFWTTVAETVLFAMAVNLLFGQLGMLSFGQAAYFGLGAYTAGWFVGHTVNPLLMLLLAAAVAAVAALVIGLVTLRTTSLVFAMLTLAFGMSLYAVTFDIPRIGGENGIVGILPSNLGGIVLADPRPLWIFEALVTSVLVALLWLLSHSAAGRALRMTRDDPVRAEVLGLPVFRYRLAAFVLSGALCGIAGVLYVWIQTVASPNVFYWTTSGIPVIVSLLGGVNVFYGPVFGAVVYTWATDTLSQLTASYIFYIGLGFLLVVLVAPQGVLGAGLDFLQRRRGRAR